MKNKLFIFVLLLGFFVNQVQAQDSINQPNVSKYYQYSWEEYITRKIVVNFMNENDFSFSDEMLKLLNGTEENDTVFQLEVIKYFGIAQNRQDVLQWTVDYASTIPVVRDKINKDQIVDLIKDEFEDFLTQQILDELDNLKLTKTETKIIVSGAKYPQ